MSKFWTFNDDIKTNVCYSKKWDTIRMLPCPKYRLYFTRGLPRSGKSTLAYKIGTVKKCFGGPLIVICADDFRLAVHGPTQYNHRSEGVVASCMWTAISALLMKYDIILDDTNSSEWSIRKIFEIDKNAQYVEVTTFPGICLGRMIEKYHEEHSIYMCEQSITRITKQLETTDVEKIRSEYINT